MVIFDNYKGYDDEFLEEAAWEGLRHILDAWIKSVPGVLVKGTIGSWRGPLDCGKVVNSYNELSDFWRDCDYIKVYTNKGHLYIECSHHDGTNYAEVKELTNKGLERYENGVHAYEDMRSLHNKLWNSSVYTHCARIEKKPF